MEIKAMVHGMAWMVVDGLAAVWVLHILSRFMGDGNLADVLRVMSETLCG